MKYLATLVLLFTLCIGNNLQASEEEREEGFPPSALIDGDRNYFIQAIVDTSELAKRENSVESLVPILHRSTRMALAWFKHHECTLAKEHYLKLIESSEEDITLDDLFEKEMALSFFINEKNIIVPYSPELEVFQSNILEIGKDLTVKHLIEQIIQLNAVCYLYSQNLNSEHIKSLKDVRNLMAVICHAEQMTRGGGVLRQLVPQLRLDADSPCITYLTSLNSISCPLAFPVFSRLLQSKPEVLEGYLLLMLQINTILNNNVRGAAIQEQARMAEEINVLMAQCKKLQELNQTVIQRLKETTEKSKRAEEQTKKDTELIIRMQKRENDFAAENDELREQITELKKTLSDTSSEFLDLGSKVEAADQAIGRAQQENKQLKAKLAETKTSLTREFQKDLKEQEEKHKAEMQKMREAFEAQMKAKEEEFQAKLKAEKEAQKAIMKEQKFSIQLLEQENLLKAQRAEQLEIELASQRKEKEEAKEAAEEKVKAITDLELRMLDEMDAKTEETEKQKQELERRTAQILELERKIQDLSRDIEDTEVVKELQARISKQNAIALDYDTNMTNFYWHNIYLQRQIAWLNSQLQDLSIYAQGQEERASQAESALEEHKYMLVIRGQEKKDLQSKIDLLLQELKKQSSGLLGMIAKIEKK